MHVRACTQTQLVENKELILFVISHQKLEWKKSLKETEDNFRTSLSQEELHCESSDKKKKSLHGI